MKNSTIVVLPSYREGFPKILMEAAASGKPIITTNVPGCRDAIINGVTGILVKPKNFKNLAKAIFELSNDKKKLSFMSKNAGNLQKKILIQNILLIDIYKYTSLYFKNLVFEMNKISLIIPSNSSSFYVEDLLINLLMWSQKPQELILINTSKKKFKIKKEIKNKFKNLKIKMIIINKEGYFRSS